MVKHLFSQILADHRIESLSEDQFDLEWLKTIYQENHDDFLHEYQKTYCQINQNVQYGNCSETAGHSLILLKLIEINILLKLDSQLLSDSFVSLSNMTQQLETIYATETYESRWGTVIAYKMNGKVCKLLRQESDHYKDFIINAVSRIPVTNTTLALWNHCAMKHYGVRVSRKVILASKAMYFHDRILGSGICDILLNNSQEATEKKLTAFTSIGLHELSERILAYYSCKTGNEKKRFLSDIENYIGDFNMIEAVNRFLSEN